MQIAARHGYRDGFHSAAALMDRARVVPTRHQRFALAADIFPLRERKGKIIELPVIERDVYKRQLQGRLNRQSAAAP